MNKIRPPTIKGIHDIQFKMVEAFIEGEKSDYDFLTTCFNLTRDEDQAEFTEERVKGKVEVYLYELDLYKRAKRIFIPDPKYEGYYVLSPEYLADSQVVDEDEVEERNAEIDPDDNFAPLHAFSISKGFGSKKPENRERSKDWITAMAFAPNVMRSGLEPIGFKETEKLSSSIKGVNDQQFAMIKAFLEGEQSDYDFLTTCFNITKDEDQAEFTEERVRSKVKLFPSEKISTEDSDDGNSSESYMSSERINEILITTKMNSTQFKLIKAFVEGNKSDYDFLTKCINIFKDRLGCDFTKEVVRGRVEGYIFNLEYREKEKKIAIPDKE